MKLSIALVLLFSPLLGFSQLDLTDIEQQQECFHYSNTQPLYKSDNRSKGDKYL